MKVALVQMSSLENPKETVKKATKMIGDAAEKGAKIACLQELLSIIYFAFEQNSKYLDWTETIPGDTTNVMSEVAKKNNIAVIALLFEKDAVVPGLFYNTTVIIDDKGRYLGKYRKNSPPQLPDYEEKFHFKNRDLGYLVFGLKDLVPRMFSFSHALRSNLSCGNWSCVLNASLNTIFVVGVSHVGSEYPKPTEAYYRNSMVADATRSVAARASEKVEVLIVDISLEKLGEGRRIASFLMDRRPELHQEITMPLDI